MTTLKGITVSLATKVDEEALNLYLDEIEQEVLDTWGDVKVDYTSIEDYLKEKIDVDYLIEKGIIEIIVE
ncbi:MAG: hypothetical protein KBT03_00210 [Bacteroidales bacterium]|nr:hypothetical protein [Candidatus Scybalousia scybalohippi]